MQYRHFTDEEKHFFRSRISSCYGCGGFEKYHCELDSYKNNSDIVFIGCEVNKKYRRGFQKKWYLMHKDVVDAWLEFKERRTHNVSQDIRTWYEVAHKYKLWGDDISVEEENHMKELQKEDCDVLDTLNYSVDTIRAHYEGKNRMSYELTKDMWYDLIALYLDEFVA